MSIQKKTFKNKKLKAELNREIMFLKNVFSVLSIPIQKKGDYENNEDFEIVNGTSQHFEEKEIPKRAHSIAELEEKLEKIKSQHNYNLKTKLMRKSLTSKLNKKVKKRERLNKTKIKSSEQKTKVKNEMSEKTKVNVAKPVFNTDGKLVFSKFDFANVGQKDKNSKVEKDPRKLLENIKQQEEKFRRLEETEDGSKVKELKEKIAWKTVLQKAEGQKIKDDPTLLKKTIKKTEQRKKQSTKQWENRINNVKQKQDDRQKKRKENIAKKKKEKKSKIIKGAVKRGRVVI